jgi:hypothetical protein
MALNVTRAVVGDVLMSTVPVLNVFPGTDAVSVKSASTLMLSSATNAANTTIVAMSLRAISSPPIDPRRFDGYDLIARIKY